MPEYIAYVTAPLAEADRLRDAITPDQPANAVQINGSDAEVYMEFGAPSFSDALKQLVQTYANLRKAAGLEPLDPESAKIGPAV